MTTITFQPVAVHQVTAMLTYACDLVQAYPTASAEAVAEKLLTIWQGTERALRLHVAATARLTVHQLAA